MAKSTLCEQGEITEVYYPFGTFTNDQRKKFLKAPFDIVRIGTEEYIQPLPVGSSAAELNGLINSSTISTEQYMGRRDFGFVNLNPLVVQEHEIGGSDQTTWKGCHFFDLI